MFIKDRKDRHEKRFLKIEHSDDVQNLECLGDRLN